MSVCEEQACVCCTGQRGVWCSVYLLLHRLELLVVRRQVNENGALSCAVEGQVRIGT